MTTEVSDECDICGKTLKQHNMGSGYASCGIIPLFRPKVAALSPQEDAPGSITLDSASVQRLLDYGVLHHDNGKWEVRQALDSKTAGDAEDA